MSGNNVTPVNPNYRDNQPVSVQNTVSDRSKIQYSGLNMPTKESIKSLGAQDDAFGHIRRNAMIMIVITSVVLFILFCLLITGTNDASASFYGFFVTMFVITVGAIWTGLDNRGAVEVIQKTIKT